MELKINIKTFFIKNNFKLKKENKLIILYLYYPIIGYKAYNLYLILMNNIYLKKFKFENNKNYDFKKFLFFLNIKLKKWFFISKLLINTGLLKIIEFKKKFHLILKPQLPLSFESFFLNLFLSKKLINKIGKENFSFFKKNFFNFYNNKFLEKENLDKNLNMKDLKIREMSTIEPIEYLTLLRNNKKPTINEINIIKSLIINYNLKFCVINCLIEYVWFKNKDRIEKKYCEKIAKTLKELNINNVIKAMEHFKKAYFFSFKKNQNQKKTFNNKFINKIKYQKI